MVSHHFPSDKGTFHILFRVDTPYFWVQNPSAPKPAVWPRLIPSSFPEKVIFALENQRWGWRNIWLEINHPQTSRNITFCWGEQGLVSLLRSQVFFEKSGLEKTCVWLAISPQPKMYSQSRTIFARDGQIMVTVLLIQQFAAGNGPCVSICYIVRWLWWHVKTQ